MKGPGPWTWQQSSPASQQTLPQHVLVPPQFVLPKHGCAMHPVPLQNGVEPLHSLPQLPQLLMSFCRFTHFPSQQVSPNEHVP